MSEAYLSSETLDDLLHEVTEKVLADGIKINPTKGEAIELAGVILELTNPLARISRTESRGKLFSCLGELMWYLAKSNDLGFIEYYIPEYQKSADGDQIFGGYGPRLFNWDGINQFGNVCDLLRSSPDTRRAAIQLFAAQDLMEPHNDVPCTCTLQFMIRNGQLNLMTYMRSNDIFLGLPHDIFCFTMLQEIMASHLEVGLGIYKHMVGSLHIYCKNVPDMEDYLGEGWQPTSALMPPMPIGDPRTSIQTVLQAEQAIRLGQSIDDANIGALDPYWADLVRLLQVFRASRYKDTNLIRGLRQKMSSTAYHHFIDQRL